MWFHRLVVSAALLGLTGSNHTTPLSQPHTLRTPLPSRNAKIIDSYGKLPLSFEVNRGQADASAHFFARGKGYTLFLTSTEAVLALMQSAIGSGQGLARAAQPQDGRATILRMQLVGANPNAQADGREELAGKVNYFIGNDPTRWRTNVPTYTKVQYHEVYPGVDLVYYGNQRQLEYDFVVAPGADPTAIRLAFAGAENIEMDAHGDLVLHAPGGHVRLHKPLVYQEVDGVKQVISGNYILLEPETPAPRSPSPRVGFQVAAYDMSKPLIIDPVLSYSTYLGGSSDDRGIGIAVDAAGNAYVTGVTASANFPTAIPFQATLRGPSDAFVMKLNAAGSALVYSTYLGGSGGENLVGGAAIAVDAAGNAYVTGHTDSTDFPTVNPFQTFGGQNDAFVTKLNPAGSALVYSTYLGGGGNDFGTGIAVDVAGNAYVTGTTNSTQFPTANPVQVALGGGWDGFVTKLNAAGSGLVYSTYLGGSNDENIVFLVAFNLMGGIAVDAAGNAYVTGETASTNFPTASPLQPLFGGGFADAFVTKINPAGSALVYSTYLGGSDFERGLGIAVDSAGNAYVTGQTSSPDFPTVNPLQTAFGGDFGDAFVTKLNAAGSALVYSTYLGGSGDDIGNAIVVDAAGNAYVTGETASTNFPTASPLQPLFGGGFADAFVTKINPAGSALVYSTYLGGSSSELGRGIAVDSAGNAYVTGSTQSSNFPTASFQTSLGGATDAFVARIADSPTPGSDDGSDLSCFIATAAYGSHLDPHVQSLRQFRDSHLMRNPAGRALVTLYYTYSPPLAAVIARHETLRIATRVVLTPLVYTVSYPIGASAFAVVAVSVAGWALRMKRRSHRSRASRADHSL